MVKQAAKDITFGLVFSPFILIYFLGYLAGLVLDWAIERFLEV